MRPLVRPPRLRCTLFPLIYPPHLPVLPATFGLHLLLQTYPHFRALYVVPVRRTKGLPTTSFRFHLAMDTLVVQLYTSSLPRRIRDFHPLERAHGAQTKRDFTEVGKVSENLQFYLSPKLIFIPSPDELVGKYGINLSAIFEIGMLCKYTFPGPVITV